MYRKSILSVLVLIILLSCGPKKEISKIEATQYLSNSKNEFLNKMIEKPGGGVHAVGKYGGMWNATLSNDPTTFNLIRINDLPTSTLMSKLFPYLLNYDVYKREWSGNLVDYEIKVDEKNDKLDVVFTLKEGLVWYVRKTQEEIPITSDDVVFWFENVIKNKELGMAEYSSVEVTMKDGSIKKIIASKIDNRTFVIRYPRIVADPLLTSNMQFGPKFLFEESVRKGDVEGILNLLSINSDVQSIPTAGAFYIEKYLQGVSLILKKNPCYHKKDVMGNSLPYIDGIKYHFVSNQATKLLMFKKGELETFDISPEFLEDLVNSKDSSFDIINGGPALTSSFITWNQNPKSLEKKYFNWFSQKEFRQAMSLFFDRERIIDKVYRGLAAPAKYFFSIASPVFNEDINFKYMYNPAKGYEVLKSIGIEKKSDGFCYDKLGNRIVYDLSIVGDNAISVDIANLYADELKKHGITLNIRVLDFNKLIDSLLYTYDWHSAIIGLSGANIFPTGGSNVWPSNGNLHMWYPNQKTPATKWEARIDLLYNEGAYTSDKLKAKAIWDEYQSIILEEVPVLYMFLPYSFLAVQKKWGNITFDYLDSFDIDYIFLN